jgi:uncharacterized protein
MQHRILGKSGLKVSEIGLGTEYLINLPAGQAEAVVGQAIERGINYFDLFFANPAFRDTMGAAFAPYRQRAHLAAHVGAIDVDGQYDKTREVRPAREMFEDFLRRYHTEYVDVAYIHNVDDQATYDQVMQPDGILGLAQRLKAEGKARSIGFSGHTVATAQAAVETGDIDVLMFPLNLAGHAVPGRKELLLACQEHNVGVVAMKPFAGGKLLQLETTLELEKWHRGGDAETMQRKGAITPVQCLAYVFSLPAVSTIVPGCQTLDQLEGALAYLSATAEQRDFSSILAGFERYDDGECVYCNHCLPCPAGIDIGQTIRLLETAARPPAGQQRRAYATLPTPASACLECGDCTPRCPFGVNPQARIGEAALWFEGGKK